MFWEFRTKIGLGNSILDKAGKVVLHSEGDGRIEDRHRRTAAGVESVRYVFSMKSGRDAELVRVGSPVVSPVEVVGVADKDDVRGSQCDSLDRVVVTFGSIKHRRIQVLCDMRGDLGRDICEILVKCARKIARVEAGRRSKEESFIRVMSDHDVQIVVEAAFCKELAWHLWHECPVDNRAVCKGSVDFGHGDLVRVRVKELVRWKLSRLLNRVDTKYSQELLQSILLLLWIRKREPAGALDDRLLEGRRSASPAICGNLMHD